MWEIGYQVVGKELIMYVNKMVHSQARPMKRIRQCYLIEFHVNTVLGLQDEPDYDVSVQVTGH